MFCPRIDVICTGRPTAFETTWPGNIKYFVLKGVQIWKYGLLCVPLAAESQRAIHPSHFECYKVTQPVPSLDQASRPQTSSHIVHVAFH